MDANYIIDEEVVVSYTFTGVGAITEVKYNSLAQEYFFLVKCTTVATGARTLFKIEDYMPQNRTN